LLKFFRINHRDEQVHEQRKGDQTDNNRFHNSNFHLARTLLPIIGPPADSSDIPIAIPPRARICHYPQDA
jgi:hypothetical protein